MEFRAKSTSSNLMYLVIILRDKNIVPIYENNTIAPNRSDDLLIL